MQFDESLRALEATWQTLLRNSRKLCTAGFRERDVVLSAIVDYVSGRFGDSDELALTVGGLISRRREHVRWIKRRKLRSGDEIRVRIIDTKSVDSPRERSRDNKPTHLPGLRERKQYIRDMAKKWGWTITTRRSRPSKARK